MPEQISGQTTGHTSAKADTRLRPPDTPRPDLPDQVVMPLLDRIVRQSLDEDYEVVAARKARSRRGRRPEDVREHAWEAGSRSARDDLARSLPP